MPHSMPLLSLLPLHAATTLHRSKKDTAKADAADAADAAAPDAASPRQPLPQSIHNTNFITIHAKTPPPHTKGSLTNRGIAT